MQPGPGIWKSRATQSENIEAKILMPFYTDVTLIAYVQRYRLTIRQRSVVERLIEKITFRCRRRQIYRMLIAIVPIGIGR